LGFGAHGGRAWTRMRRLAISGPAATAAAVRSDAALATRQRQQQWAGRPVTALSEFVSEFDERRFEFGGRTGGRAVVVKAERVAHEDCQLMRDACQNTETRERQRDARIRRSQLRRECPRASGSGETRHTHYHTALAHQSETNQDDGPAGIALHKVDQAPVKSDHPCAIQTHPAR
jgi:hypothetical protein